MGIRLDIVGRYLKTKHEEDVPETASLQLGNKMFEVRKDGTSRIEATEKEAK